MMATAAVTAGAFLQIGFGWNAAQFQRLGNEFLDAVLKLVKFLLRVQKTAGEGIFQQFVALFFKIGDFRGINRLPVVLFFVMRVAFAHHRFVLAARPGVGKTSFALQVAHHNADRDALDVDYVDYH